MKKILTVYVYSSFLMGVSSSSLTASYFTLPNNELTLNHLCKYTSCNPGNALTYLGVVRTAARHSFDEANSANFIGTLSGELY